MLESKSQQQDKTKINGRTKRRSKCEFHLINDNVYDMEFNFFSNNFIFGGRFFSCFPLFFAFDQWIPWEKILFNEEIKK